MGCAVHFDPTKRSGITYICGCGWSGSEPKVVLVPHSWHEIVNGRILAMEAAGDSDRPFGYECPNCGAELESRELVLDIGLVPYTVTKKWPNGREYVKVSHRPVEEIRLVGDVRHMGSYQSNKWAGKTSRILLKALAGDLVGQPKPKMKDFENPGAFFQAHKAHKAKWRDLYKASWTARQLVEVMQVLYPNDWVEATTDVLDDLGLDPRTLRAAEQVKFISLASDKRKERMAAGDKVISRMIGRVKASKLYALAEAAGHYHLAGFALNVIEWFGDIYVRNTVISAMATRSHSWHKIEGNIDPEWLKPRLAQGRVEQRDGGCWYWREDGKVFEPGLYLIKQASLTRHDKNLWFKADYMAEHPEFWQKEEGKKGWVSYEALPEFSMDRGKPIRERGNGSWIYDPNTEGMIQVAPETTDLHYVQYREDDVHEVDSDGCEEDTHEQEDVIDYKGIQMHGAIGVPWQLFGVIDSDDSELIGDELYLKNQGSRPDLEDSADA